MQKSDLEWGAVVRSHDEKVPVMRRIDRKKKMRKKKKKRYKVFEVTGRKKLIHVTENREKERGETE